MTTAADIADRHAAVEAITNDLAPTLDAVASAVEAVRKRIQPEMDGKLLKGGELTGWLGELYAKLLLGGEIVDDSHEWDVVAGDRLVAVKARRQVSGSSWKRSGIIPRFEGDALPTHLAFIHFDNAYRLANMWLYPWQALVDGDRFRLHTVRGHPRGWYVMADPERDAVWRWPTGEVWQREIE